MQVATHTVQHGATAEGSPAAAAAHDDALGWAGCAHAQVHASLLDAELACAASRLALDTVLAHVRKHGDLRVDEPDRERVLDVLRTGINIASREINALSARRNVQIQVTIDVVWALAGEAFVAHVGDGRAYLLRKGLSHKLTQDHILGDALHESLPGQSPRLRQRTAPARSLGPETTVETETMNLQLVDGDRMLLTSPYLHRGLDDFKIREVANDPLADGVTARLLGAARDNGVDADLACVLMEVGDLEESRSGAAQSRLSTLARIPMFAYCTERELLAIAGVTRPVRFRSDSWVFRQGDPGSGLYLVVQGQVAIEIDGNDIATLGPGANFGEMSMLDQPERSAGARTLEDTELLLITREAFFAMLKRDPTLAVKVLWNMLLRLSASLRATSERLTNPPSEPPVQ